MKADSIWKELEEDPNCKYRNGILKRLIFPDSKCKMFFGLRIPSKSRVFILQIPEKYKPGKEQIPESRGFNVTIEKPGDTVGAEVTLVVDSIEKINDEIFSAMAITLSGSLKACENNQQAVNTFLATIRRWQKFFEKCKPEGLSEEAQQGLYGELYFLKTLLLANNEYLLENVSAWTGPKKRHHDFQFGDTAIEVKTSTSKQQQKLYISSEQQLDEQQVGKLYIFHLSLALVEGHYETLPKLVNDLRVSHSLKHSALLLFEEGLEERGYLNTQTWRYEKRGYVIRESSLYHVVDDFPRLTERQIPTGVGDLKYSISVAACKRFSVPYCDVLSKLHREK